MANCEGCPYGGKTIGSRGNPEASFVIVGEAPGSKELATGRPFTGPSGIMLWGAFEKAGLPRPWENGHVFITHAMACRPTETPPSNRAIQSCHTRLASEVGTRADKVILALGNSALRSLTGRNNLKMTSERGKVIDSVFGRIIPTWHPASILRDPGKFKQLVADVDYAVSLWNGKAAKHPGEVKYRVVRDHSTALAFVEALRSAPLLAADIETSGFNPRQDRILDLGICWEKNKVVIFPHQFVTPEILGPLFDDPNPTWIWHNGKFDTGFLHHAGLNARVDQDCMLMHYALDETKGTHDLKQLSADYLGAESYEDVVKQYAGPKSEGYSSVPKKILYPYLARDCDYTFQLYGELKKELDAQSGLRQLYERILLPASRFLQRVENHGFYIDRARLGVVRSELTEKRDTAAARLGVVADKHFDPALYAADTEAKKIPKEFNPASSKQLTWLLFDRLRLRPTKKGVPLNTREDTLKLLPPNDVVEALLDFREAQKALSTYVDGILERIERDGRVHSTYLLHGTATGRLASRNPNLQNIPRSGLIKTMFAAMPGRVLIEIDYDQAELRCLAHLSRDPFLMQCYQLGRKLHHEVAVEMYGEGYDAHQYIRAKAVNFGIAYGRREHSLAREFDIPLTEAKDMVDAWFNRAPVAYAYLESCRRAPLEGKALVSVFGRQRRFHMVNEKNLNEVQNEASNFPISSMASDLLLSSAMICEPVFREEDAYIVNLVHDSMVIDAPDNPEVIERVITYGIQTMCSLPKKLFNSPVPFAADAKVGYNWGQTEKFVSRKELVTA